MSCSPPVVARDLVSSVLVLIGLATTILERVLVIASRRALSLHDVSIQEIEGRKPIALAVEVDRAMSLGDAHVLLASLPRGQTGPDSLNAIG